MLESFFSSTAVRGEMRLEKARPAGARFEFRVGRKQRISAGRAHENALLVIVRNTSPLKARSVPPSRITSYVPGRQHRAPLGITLHDFVVAIHGCTIRVGELVRGRARIRIRGARCSVLGRRPARRRARAVTSEKCHHQKNAEPTTVCMMDLRTPRPFEVSSIFTAKLRSISTQLKFRPGLVVSRSGQA